MEHIQLHKSPLFLKIIFIISVAIIFFIGAITFKHITVLKKSSTWIAQSYEVNIELERLLSYVKDAETGQRGYLLSKDKNFLTPYYSSKQRIKKSYKRVAESFWWWGDFYYHPKVCSCRRQRLRHTI